MKNTTVSFRSPISNSRYTRQLFYEQMITRPMDDRVIDPPYTLYHEKPGKVCFRKEYVALNDPTGFKLAERYLEDYNHWQLLMKAPWFREAKEVWDSELESKLAAEAMDAIKLLANGVEGVPAAVQLSAAKFLATKAYKAPAAKGRPSAAEITRQAKVIAEVDSELQADLDRISLNTKG